MKHFAKHCRLMYDNNEMERINYEKNGKDLFDGSDYT